MNDEHENLTTAGEFPAGVQATILLAALKSLVAERRFERVEGTGGERYWSPCNSDGWRSAQSAIDAAEGMATANPDPRQPVDPVLDAEFERQTGQTPSAQQVAADLDAADEMLANACRMCRDVVACRIYEVLKREYAFAPRPKVSVKLSSKASGRINVHSVHIKVRVHHGPNDFDIMHERGATFATAMDQLLAKVRAEVGK